MAKLEIKKIKGKKYIYIKDEVRVNDKTLRISIYVDRLKKTTLQDFLAKIVKLQQIKLTKFTDFWMKKRRTFLDDAKTMKVEALHYSYNVS